MKTSGHLEQEVTFVWALPAVMKGSRRAREMEGFYMLLEVLSHPSWLATPGFPWGLQWAHREREREGEACAEQTELHSKLPRRKEECVIEGRRCYQKHSSLAGSWNATKGSRLKPPQGQSYIKPLVSAGPYYMWRRPFKCQRTPERQLYAPSKQRVRFSAEPFFFSHNCQPELLSRSSFPLCPGHFELPLWIFLTTEWNNKPAIKSSHFVEDGDMWHRLIKGATPSSCVYSGGHVWTDIHRNWWRTTPEWRKTIPVIIEITFIIASFSTHQSIQSK